METLTPIQRIAVVTIGLVLTLIIAALVLPWISEQIEALLLPTGPPMPPAATRQPLHTPSPSPTPVAFIQSMSLPARH